MQATFLVYAMSLISVIIARVVTPVSSLGTLRVICSLWIVNKVTLLITFSHMTFLRHFDSD